MIYCLICKLRQTKLKSRLKGNFKHIEFAGNIEVTSPETVHLSDYLYVGPNCKMYGRGNLNISSNVIIGNDVKFLTSNHNYKGDMLPYDSIGINKDIVIEKNVWIASFAFILPGVTVHEGAVVGGGCLVTKDVPSCAIVGGNPAQIIGYRDKDKYVELDKNEQYYLVSKYGK